MRSWLQDCVTSHSCSEPIWKDHFSERARVSADSHLLDRPCRLIDLFAFGENSPNAALVLAEGTTGHYVALSHRWGLDPISQYCTTSANLASRQCQIRYSDLPKTFRDSFDIVRRLGIKYIWIDSICILQGDDSASKEDWAREASKMGSVYSNAYITIAAELGSDSHSGCFNEHSKNQLDRFKVVQIDSTLTTGQQSTLFIQDDNIPVYLPSTVGRGLLSDRAWICQELLLSRRVLHYTKDQVSKLSNLDVRFLRLSLSSCFGSVAIVTGRKTTCRYGGNPLESSSSHVVVRCQRFDTTQLINIFTERKHHFITVLPGDCTRVRIW